MVAVPAAPPVTVPATTVATVVLLLLHTPPVVVSVRAVVSPAHILLVPLIAAGLGFTVNEVVVIQPVGSV